MNLRGPFARTKIEIPKDSYEVPFDTDKPMAERTRYLADCSNIVTDNPLITAACEQDFRVLFGIGEDQKSVTVQEAVRKGLGRKEQPAHGLFINIAIPNQCMTFSLIFENCQMHAVIKQARPEAPLHLDALNIFHSGGELDIPCGEGGVEKLYLQQLMDCFSKTAAGLAGDRNKSLVEQEFKLELGNLRMLLEVSIAREASLHSKELNTGRHHKR